MMQFLSFLVVLSFMQFGTFANHTEVNPFEIRTTLLMETVKELGITDSYEAVEVWAKGVQSRNGAMQAAVMDDALQETYILSLNDNFPNWVTGVSSPWVSSYQIERQDDDGNRFIVEFVTETGSGYYATYEVQLTLIEENGCWKISGIGLDNDELKAYTGF